MLTLVSPTKQQYDKVFEEERLEDYGIVSGLEKDLGYKLDKKKMERAARVLACPVKVNPPNWQHGRVIYAVTRKYLADGVEVPVQFLDIGTAKGFSSLCLKWALDDSGLQGTIDSVDVISPDSHERRNTVSEIDGLKTLYEILNPWPEASGVRYHASTGVGWLSSTMGRVNLAFIDGKHSFASVSMEAELLSKRQHRGDIAIFDDVQIPGVGDAVMRSRGYDIKWMRLNKLRAYAICTRV